MSDYETAPLMSDGEMAGAETSTAYAVPNAPGAATPPMAASADSMTQFAHDYDDSLRSGAASIGPSGFDMSPHSRTSPRLSSVVEIDPREELAALAVAAGDASMLSSIGVYTKRSHSRASPTLCQHAEP